MANLANSAKSLEIQGFSPRTDRRTAGELRQFLRWLWVDYEWIRAVGELVWLRLSTQPHLSTARKSWFDDIKVGFKWVQSGFIVGLIKAIIALFYLVLMV